MAGSSTSPTLGFARAGGTPIGVRPVVLVGCVLRIAGFARLGYAEQTWAVITGCKAARNRPLTRGQKLPDKALAAVRAPVEHGFAPPRNWRTLGKVRTDPKGATTLVRGLLVLTNREVSR